MDAAIAAITDAGGSGATAGAYKAAFRRHAAGVAVVTVDTAGGPTGFTAGSVVSLSLEPPLLSFTVAARNSLWPAFRDARWVVVNLLAADQEDTARTFATAVAVRSLDPATWWRLPTGEPALSGAPVWLRCRIDQRLPLGDHYLVVATVVEATVRRHAPPLLYQDGGYHTLTPLP